MSTKAYINGIVYRSKGNYAQAVFCRDGIIEAVGTNEEISALLSEDTEIIDLNGKTLLPGLHDSHLHMGLIGLGMRACPIADCDGIESLIERCRSFIAEHPERYQSGFYASGWNQNKFTAGDKRMPNRYDLDRISTEIPVVLERICGHVVCGNSRAIELLGITRNPVQPSGGTIELDKSGNPTGIFTENYCSEVTGLIPTETCADWEEAFLLAQDYALSKGLTAVQSCDAGLLHLSFDEIFDTLGRIYSDGRGKIRFREQTCCKTMEELEEFLAAKARFESKYPNLDLCKIGPLKLFKDGSLGGKTALMRNGYVGDPENHGVAALSDELFTAMCRRANEAGVQVVTHAIGDGAVESVTRAYIAVGGYENPLRNAIIHCQMTTLPQLKQIAAANIPVMYQPCFLEADMHIAEALCGKELVSTSYAFRTAMELGISVSFGTDSPVEDLDPFENIKYAVKRMDKNGYPEGGFYPKERVSVEEAIDAYTVGSAYVAGDEKRLGRIERGFVGEVTVGEINPLDGNQEEGRTVNITLRQTTLCGSLDIL